MDHSITKFLGEINGQGGIAPKNRFSVEIDYPATVQTNISREQLNVFCDTTAMPGHRITTTEYLTVANPIMVPYSFTTEPVVFIFYLGKDLSIKSFFYSWMELIINTESYVLAYKRSIVANFWTVWQHDKQNNKTRGVKLWNVMPVEVAPLEYSNGSEELQMLSVTIDYDRRELI